MFVPSLSVCNGVATFAVNYVTRISGYDDIKVDFLLAHDVPGPYYEMLKRNGCNIYFLPETHNVIKINNWLDAFFGQYHYDIIHSNVINLGYFVLKKAKKYGIKCRIMHAHVTQNGETTMQKVIRFPFQKLAMRYVNGFLACSELAGKFMFPKEKFTIINNGIDLERFKYDEHCSESIRKELGIGPNTKVIGHVGRFVKQKNHDYLLEVFKEIVKKRDNVKLLLLGDGPLLQGVRRKAKELGIESKVIFAGSKTDIHRYYSAMDLFVFPSLYEGLCLTAVEAQANGLYCLVSNNITKELKMTENIEFLDIKENPTVWAEEAIRHLDCEGATDRLSANYAMKNSKFDINHEKDKLIMFYEEILKQSNVGIGD